MFPTKSKDETLQKAFKEKAHELCLLNPDFISITCGAGGSDNTLGTIDAASSILNNERINTVVHMTCTGLTFASALETLKIYASKGIKNILVLRGDKRELCTDFKHADELISFIRRNTGNYFNIFAACHPDGHPESDSLRDDIANLKRKVDAGADALITQVFFDNEVFENFREHCLIAGIDAPILAGIMPVTNQKQILRMTSMCSISLPNRFTSLLQRYGDNPEALRDAGLSYACDQIVDLVAQDTNGIHLYILNNVATASTLANASRLILSH